MKIRSLIFSLVLGCVPLCGFAQQNNKAAFYKSFNDGNKKLVKKDSIGAAKSYMDAIKAAPNEATAYERVGMIYSTIQKRQYQKLAKEHYEKFIELTKDDTMRQAAKEKLVAIEEFLEKTKDEENANPFGLENPQNAAELAAAQQATAQQAAALQQAQEVPGQQQVAQLTAQPTAEAPQDADEYIPAQDEMEEALISDSDNPFLNVIIDTAPPAVPQQNNFAGSNQPARPVQANNPVRNTNDPFNLGASNKPNPFNTGGKPNPFNTNGNNGRIASNGQSSGYTYKPNDDKLYQAYRWTDRSNNIDENKPLYVFQHPVQSPLASELLNQLENGGQRTSTDGRWASTLRNSDTKRELFLIKISSDGRQLDVLPESDIVLRSQKGLIKGGVKEKQVDGLSASCLYEFNFTETSFENIANFITYYIEPYIGTKTEHNLNWLRVLLREKNPRYKVHCGMALNVQSAKNALHGSLEIDMKIDRDSVIIPVLSQIVPCTMYRIGDDYAGFDIQTVKHPGYAKADSTLAVTIQSKTVRNANDKNNLGYCFLNGLGVQQNYEKAATYFEDAAKEGSKEALLNLYLLYRHGWGKKSHLGKAFEQLAAAREAKNAEAFSLSADLMLDAPTPDERAAYMWFEQAIKNNNAHALFRLGQMAKEGVGQPQNYQAAIGRFNDAAKLGSGDAFYEIALMYLNGLNNPKRDAYNAYKSASNGAQSNSLKAMQMVAEMYFTGIGVRPSFSNGLKWIRLMKEEEYRTLNGYKYVEK